LYLSYEVLASIAHPTNTVVLLLRLSLGDVIWCQIQRAMINRPLAKILILEEKPQINTDKHR
jgi:hypothetical protein